MELKFPKNDTKLKGKAGKKFIPWQSSLSSNTSKQNSKDRYGGGGGTNTSNRYSPRTSTYNATTSAASNAKRDTANSNSTSTSSSVPSSGGASYHYRKATPSILKKYANFSATSAAAKVNADSNDGPRKDGAENKCAASSIPRCKPFSKFAADPAIGVLETQGLRYGSASRFGSQIARSPIKEKTLPVFGVSSPIRPAERHSPDKVVLVTRATSPTPPPNSSFLRSRRRENDDERVLVWEGRRTTSERNTVACQTVETNVTNRAPTPPSRASSLHTKFGSSGGAHTVARPTDLPLRSSSFVRSSYLSPNEASRERLSPSFFQTYHNSTPATRTPSPSLTAVRESLSNLALESNATATVTVTGDSTDTENESSYEEDYPIKCEKESSYPFVSSVPATDEVSDKPPKYPPSPNAKVRELCNNEARPLNHRTSSVSPSSGGGCSGGGSGKLDSSSEDLSAKHIPIANPSDENNNNNDDDDDDNNDQDSVEPGSKLYPIRKMDSGDLPWWLNAGSGASSGGSKSRDGQVENNAGYRIRKMDSADSPWWCKTPDSEQSAECNEGQCRRTSAEQRSSDDSRSFGYAIKKIESADTPWWCNNSEGSTTSTSKSGRVQHDEPCTQLRLRKMDSSELLWSAPNSEESSDRKPNDDLCKIRKFDSDESEWWAEEKATAAVEKRSTTPSIPEWWNDVRSENEVDGCVENYKSSKVLRITNIRPVQKNDDIGTDTTNTYSEAESRLHRLTNDEIADRRTRNEDDYKMKYINELDNLLLYIGDHTNVDELLGTEVPPPAAPVTPTGNDSSTEDELGEDCKKVTAQEVKIHDGSAYTSTIHRRNYQLDDAALQLYKDGDYSSYLDLDSSISEQQEEFEGFQPRKDSIVMRTQLSVRVHLIIEKLMKSEGRELRRALFSLKQIFQEDKDLVHEFVQNDGLDCLIKVGSDVDQNYQNYILRALGQVMLYVDGMNGVMEHNATIQWLYSLVSSKFRLVVKTALKLLLVFVEYVESNCLLLIRAIHTLNISQGTIPWSNIMRLLHEYDATDTELLIYAMTLINKTLNGIPDLDMYYDQVDLLEEQDVESVIRKYMSKQGTDLDLLRQFQIYEAVLQHEDGEDKGTPLKQLDETIRKTLRNRKSLINGTVNNDERRKSRRHSTGTTSLSHTFPVMAKRYSETSSPEDYRIKPTTEGAGVTPGLRRRRERAERQRSLLREQYENNMRALMDSSSSEDGGSHQNGSACNANIPHVCVNNTVNKLESMEDATTNFRYHQNGDVSPTLRRDATVKDITQKLATLQTPDDNKSPSVGRVEEMKGIISKAMEGLAKSQSRCDMVRSPTGECLPSQMAAIRNVEPKKSETELHWEELLATSTRSLLLCDLDFSDLKSDDEHDVLAPACNANGVPPPPPPCALPPPAPCVSKMIANKGKKTVKLFWKEVREDPIVITKLNSKQLIWDEMYPVTVDTQRLEHLFESRAKDLITKKQHELNKNKEIIVLDPKRSNAINIGMTKLPPPRSIKTAILKMDSTVMNREGIEKLLTMLPTEEERSKIQEAQAANPDLPLGTAEHFLLTLASISELTARLKLWAFKLNYENIEKEIADPLMDLKQGIEVLRANKTFRAILSTLLSIGIFLNGTEVKGFQVEYLAKVPEVKDTVHKHSLLHHLCHIVMEKFADSTDLYSEIGAITRASRIDFEELANSIRRIEQECKASFDHLKAIAKHDGNTAVKLKLSEFLADCAERIIALGKIHRRVLNRFYKFCLWLGIPLHRIQATKPNELCKIISEFALEYRTTRERVIQQLEKKASHRERNKTRGKMITEVGGKFKSKEDRQDAELRQLLGKEPYSEQNNTNTLHSGSLPWRRMRKDSAKSTRDHNLNGHFADAGDELLETLVKTATKAPASRNAPRERKRSRHSDRKSLRRTLKNGLTEEERNYLATYIKSY